MASELETLKQVCKRLESISVSYMLTGSFAASFYITPRMTRDIDIVIELVYSDIGQFMQTFGEGYYIDERVIVEAIEKKTLFNLLDEKTGVKLDFIIRKDARYRKVEFERRRKVEVSGFYVWIVSPEDLILSKLDWAKDSKSELQLRDVKSLLKIEGLDNGYIEKWATELGVLELLRTAK